MMQSKRKVFLETLKGKKSVYTPIWFMRQAGRFLEEYRTLREKYDFLTMCKTPELAAKVTLLPKSLDVDALILFSDILIPLSIFDAKLNYKDGMQPKVDLNLNNIKYTSMHNKLDFIVEAIKIVRMEAREYAILGFAASPFTLICYLFGGNEFANLRTFMKKDRNMYFKIMGELTRLTIDYLNLQLKAGCDAVQVFDSWAGIISREDYETFVLPFVKMISKEVKPSIYYIKNSCHLNELLSQTNFECFSVDWRSSLKNINQLTKKTVQGNLDNAVPLADKDVIKKETGRIILETEVLPHIFNLGHGVLPQTDPDKLKLIVDLVHEKTFQ